MIDELVKRERIPAAIDSALADRLEHLAKEGARVSTLAYEVAMITNNSRVDYLKQLKETNLLFVTCGAGDIPDYPEDLLVRAWDSVQSLIAAQFSGFSLDTKNSLKKVLSGISSPQRSEYCDLVDSSALAKRGLDWLWCPRAFSLLSLFSIALPRFQDQDAKDKVDTLHLVVRRLSDVSAALEDPNLNGELLWRVTLIKLVDKVLTMVRRTGERLQENENIEWKIDDKHWQKIKEVCDKLPLYEKRLGDLLVLDLQSETAKPSQVADIVGVLGGRYLNPALQLEPSRQSLYTQGAEYVLRHRNRGNGTWAPEYDSKYSTHSETRKDPLAGRYSPLAYLLDLPNTVLTPCVEILINAVSDALVALRRELQKYISGKPEGKVADVTQAVYDGLMIGAAVSERLRDLLSEVELNELGAEIPNSAVGWDQLPDSLGFKNNLSKGVINLWASRSESRPGAILVYGPPGTGKTTIAKSLLFALNDRLQLMPGSGPNEPWRFLSLTPADFAREGADQVIASAERLFRKLQRLRRCIVLLDEMEEFLQQRGPGAATESRLITTAFLPLLQETVNKREIILIVATNFVGTIDQAVTRRGRFDLILPLGPPDKKSRTRIVEQTLKSAPELTCGAGEHGMIVRFTMGYTWSEIKDYVNEYLTSKKSSKRCIEGPPSQGRVDSQLWRIRQERVPIALSGNPGCDWRVFRDEATRYIRSAPGVLDTTQQTQDPEYWDEPRLPDLGSRGSKREPNARLCKIRSNGASFDVALEDESETGCRVRVATDRVGLKLHDKISMIFDETSREAWVVRLEAELVALRFDVPDKISL